MTKSLDQKLEKLHQDRNARCFIIADAKDADMAFGVRATGARSYLSSRGEVPAQFSPEVWTRDEFGYRSLPEFLDIIREIVNRGLKTEVLVHSDIGNQLVIINEFLRFGDLENDIFHWEAASQ